MTEEIKIAGIGIAPEVLSAIVSRAVEQVEGVAAVGIKDIASNLVSMFSARSVVPSPSIEASVVDDQLAITVHVTVFFGYPFKKLAEGIREAVARAIDAQVGVGVASVDVCIDGLVFPKE
ncbi:MAG: Asp23/Gls24 family envelope stress response protein [Collinsella sp.]|nr:Asp23/Gls24 family envelope stress response protein [Collinsella sp.]